MSTTTQQPLCARLIENNPAIHADATANAIRRREKLALIKPVTTSTEGRWVARIIWMPVARANCAAW